MLETPIQVEMAIFWHDSIEHLQKQKEQNHKTNPLDYRSI